MPLAKELKRGHYVELDGRPSVIEQVVVQTPSARRANTLYKLSARMCSHERKWTRPSAAPICCAILR